MTNIQEQKLLKKLCAGEREAMKTLYDIYAGYLWAVCSRYIVDRENVKDVVQECFVKIFSSIRTFEYRGEGSLKAWMTRIVVNESLRFLKNSAKAGFIVFQDEISDNDNTAEEDGGGPELGSIPAEEIQKLIKRLPDGYRTVFNLYVFEEKSHKEIAEMLNIKENSSASQLHRAKAMLAGWINDYRNKN